MSKEEEPLLSDEQVYGLPRVERIAGRDIAYYPNMMRGDFVRDRYESARSKDTDLIKDMLPYMQHKKGCPQFFMWRTKSGTPQTIDVCTCKMSEVLLRVNERSK